MQDLYIETLNVNMASSNIEKLLYDIVHLLQENGSGGETVTAGVIYNDIDSDGYPNGKVTFKGKRIMSYACNGFWQITSVDIPADLVEIGASAFSGCEALTSIALPATLTKIGNYAFSGCTGLTDVYFAGTQTQWQAITIGTNNSYLTSATIHYESTGA